MSIETIPDSLASDLRDYFLAEIPEELVALDAGRVRLKFEPDNIPVPRLVILPGEPRRIPQMDGTARISVAIELVNASDKVDPDTHRKQAGALAEWLRELRGKRRDDPAPLTRCHLHDILIQHPVDRIRADQREQATVIRGEFIVTLYDPDAERI